MEPIAEQSATTGPTEPPSAWISCVLAGMDMSAPAEPSAPADPSVPAEPSQLETEIAEIVGGLTSLIDRAKSREEQLMIECAELRAQLMRAEEAEAPAKKAKKDESSSSTSK